MRFRSRFIEQVAVILATTISKVVCEDLDVYVDANLATGWENWSWSSTIDFAATDIIPGSSGSSISVNSDAWAALSLRNPATFKTYAGLKFDIAGDHPDITLLIQSVSDSVDGPSIPLSAISKNVTSDAFTTILVDFTNLPGLGTPLGEASNWDRISLQAGGLGATYHLDNVVFVESIVITPEFLSAEPLANNVVAVTTKGDVDLSAVKVALNGSPVAVTKKNTYVPVDSPSLSITYFTLAKNFAPGTLTITAGESSYNHTLPSVLSGSIVQALSTPINPHIYGVNFPTNPDYIKHLGVTISRWGGNAVTAYNPFGGFTNAGNDWYFENRNSDGGSADDWIGWVHGAGSDTLLTIPALDWVSKDNTSYSYPKTLHPDQSAYDPYNNNAGNGKFANGSWVSPPDPTTVYTPWNTTLAQTWLKGLTNKPTIVQVDNEIEIASSTHQDMHPIDIDYDEELDRIVRFATAAKAVLPGVKVAAPTTCSWWFYWTSMVGWNDTAAHDNIDFIPWFLMQMEQVERKTGRRLLDYLDIHYYFQPDTSANDDAAKALRLRMTRSLWDKTYVDESWIGTDPQNHQWSPDTVQLVPRMKTLIDINYPGTKLSISEWSSNADDELTGGLLVADGLGIFGKYGVDAATYWATPGEKAPVGLAYWLYRGYSTYFGDRTAQVNLAKPDPNTWSIYAGSDGRKLTLVIINKNPDKALSFNLSNVPTGKYFVRHFGGGAGVAKWQTILDLTTSKFIVVSGHTAVFLKQQ